jgi:hypothetical protein
VIQDRDSEQERQQARIILRLELRIEHFVLAIQEVPLCKGNTLYFTKNVFLVTKHSLDLTYAYWSDNRTASNLDS